jgi:predicted enzyme related to lactoylglutathione lyase
MPGADSLKWTGVCLDCLDARRLAEFYGQLLGWEITEDRGDWITIRDPSGGVGLNFQSDPAYVPPVWPEVEDAQQKMLHFEIATNDVDAAVSHAVAVGAAVATWQPADRDPRNLRVMLDPAGHPFCLYNDDVL